MPKKNAISDSMAGRPSNGTKQYQVQLQPELVDRIDFRNDGKSHRRSAFIREACEEKLAREELSELHRREGK